MGNEGRELARKALELMESHNVPPTPENYAVWSAYAAQGNQALCDALDRYLESGAPFNEAMNSALFEEYFNWNSVQDALMESGGAMQRELGVVRATLAAAERDASAYGEALAGATDQLQSGDEGTVKSMVDTLVSATAKMQQRSQALEKKLQETHKEINQLRSNLARVREEAMTDALTGVANRKRFDDSLDEARADAEGAGAPFSLVLCDIDFFKRFNDTWGHQTGDQIIRFVAGCLTRHAPEPYLVARYGGEEFGIVMPGASGRTAQALAEEVRKTVESKKLLRKSTNEDLGNITVSLGVAEYAPGESVEDVIARADAALYKSKQTGRNKVSADIPAAKRNAA